MTLNLVCFISTLDYLVLSPQKKETTAATNNGIMLNAELLYIKKQNLLLY